MNPEDSHVNIDVTWKGFHLKPPIAPRDSGLGGRRVLWLQEEGGCGGDGGGAGWLQNHLQSLEGAHAGRTCSSSTAAGEELLKNSDDECEVEREQL